jgi:hypothetical protein
MTANGDWIPQYALWSLGLIAVSSLVSYLVGRSNGCRSQKAAEELSARNRLTKAKDDFGGFIRDKIGTLPERDVGEFYKSTKPSIRVAVQHVWHFLTEDQRSRLDELWIVYDQIPAEKFDPKHEGKMGETMRALSKIAKPPAEFQKPSEIVRYYLDEFYKFSA